MANCRKGDIAVITRPLVEDNLGALVEILEVSTHNPPRWVVRPLGGPRPTANGTWQYEAVVADAALRPLKGPRNGSVFRRRRLQPGPDLFSQ